MRHSAPACLLERFLPSGPGLHPRGMEDRVAVGFRYLLINEDGEPIDPAMFVCAEPRWSIGDVFMCGGTTLANRQRGWGPPAGAGVGPGSRVDVSGFGFPTRFPSTP
jgi:hypothetical protein